MRKSGVIRPVDGASRVAYLIAIVREKQRHTITKARSTA